MLTQCRWSHAVRTAVPDLQDSVGAEQRHDPIQAKKGRAMEHKRICTWKLTSSQSPKTVRTDGRNHYTAPWNVLYDVKLLWTVWNHGELRYSACSSPERVWSTCFSATRGLNESKIMTCLSGPSATDVKLGWHQQTEDKINKKSKTPLKTAFYSIKGLEWHEIRGRCFNVTYDVNLSWTGHSAITLNDTEICSPQWRETNCATPHHTIWWSRYCTDNLAQGQSLTILNISGPYTHITPKWKASSFVHIKSTLQPSIALHRVLHECWGLCYGLQRL